MSEMEKDPQVNDRRRFDRDGNPRAEEPGQPAEPAQPVAVEGAASEPQQAPGGAEARGVFEGEQQLQLEKLTSELAASRRRVDELARAYKELLSDREEFKARLSRERERLWDVERGKVAQALLEALDELDLVVNASTDTDSALYQGVKLIRDGLLNRAQQFGIERLELVGRPFDPNTAEAADMAITHEEAEDQRVLAEVRAGYRLGERVIRPARVKVARYVRPAQA